MNFKNIPNGASKLNFVLHYVLNFAMARILFTLKYPWVKYEGGTSDE